MLISLKYNYRYINIRYLITGACRSDYDLLLKPILPIIKGDYNNKMQSLYNCAYYLEKKGIIYSLSHVRVYIYPNNVYMYINLNLKSWNICCILKENNVVIVNGFFESYLYIPGVVRRRQLH